MKMKLIYLFFLTLVFVLGVESFAVTRQYDVWICDLQIRNAGHNPCTEVIAMLTNEEITAIQNRKRLNFFPKTREAIINMFMGMFKVAYGLINHLNHHLPAQITPEDPRDTHARFWRELAAIPAFLYVVLIVIIAAILKTIALHKAQQSCCKEMLLDALFIALAIAIIYALMTLVPHVKQLNEKYKLVALCFVLLISLISMVRCLLVLFCQMILTTYLRKLLFAGLTFALLAGPTYSILKNGLESYRFITCNSIHFGTLIGNFLLALLQPLFQIKVDSGSTLKDTLDMLDNYLAEILSYTKEQFPLFGKFWEEEEGEMYQEDAAEAISKVKADLTNACLESYQGFTMQCLTSALNLKNQESALNVCRNKITAFLYKKHVFFLDDFTVSTICIRVVRSICYPDIASFCTFDNKPLEQQFGSVLEQWTVSQEAIRGHVETTINIHLTEDFGTWVTGFQLWVRLAQIQLEWLLQKFTEISLYAGLAFAIYAVIVPLANSTYYFVKYRRNVAFDNIYLNKYAKEILEEAGSGISPDPLRSYEHIFRKRGHCGVKNLLESLVAWENLSILCWILVSAIVYATDEIVKKLLTILKDHGTVDATFRGHLTVDFRVDGRSILAQLLRTVLKFLDIDLMLNASIDTAGCTPRERQTDSFYWYAVMSCLVALLLINPIQELLFATRSVICDFFFPDIARQRGDFIVRILFAGRQTEMDLKAAFIQDMVQKWGNPEDDYAARTCGLCCPEGCSLHSVTDFLIEKVPCCIVLSWCRTIRHSIGCHPIRHRCQVCGCGASGHCHCGTFQLCADCLLDLQSTCPACSEGGLPPLPLLGTAIPIDGSRQTDTPSSCSKVTWRCFWLSCCSISGSSMLAYSFYNMAVTMKLPTTMAVVVAGFLAVVGLPFMPRKLRCLCCLCLTELSTRKGRSFMLALLVTSVYYGPIEHFHEMTEHLATTATCINVQFHMNIKTTRDAFMNETDVRRIVNSVGVITHGFHTLQQSTDNLQRWYDETLDYASQRGFSVEYVRQKLTKNCVNHIDSVKQDCKAKGAGFLCQTVDIAYPFCRVINDVVEIAVPLLKRTIVQGLRKLWNGMKKKIGQIVNLHLGVTMKLEAADEDIEFLQKYTQKLKLVFKEQWSKLEQFVKLFFLLLQWLTPFCLIFGPCYYLCRYLHQTNFDNIHVTSRMKKFDVEFSESNESVPVSTGISAIKACCHNVRGYFCSILVDICLGGVVFGIAYADWLVAGKINHKLALLANLVAGRNDWTLFTANIEGEGAMANILKTMLAVLSRMQGRATDMNRFVDCFAPVKHPVWDYANLGAVWGVMFLITVLKPILKVSGPIFCNAFFPKHEALRFRALKLSLAYEQAIDLTRRENSP